MYTWHVSAESWPQKFDDSGAREDWGWKHQYNIPELSKAMFDYLIPLYRSQGKLYNY